METIQGRDCYFESNGLKLHYVEWGDQNAPALVMLHGVASFARIWDHVAPDLQSQYRVIALDWRGHGDSDWAPAGRYGYDDYMSDLDALFSVLDLRNVNIVAHSLGGIVSLYYASKWPERIRTIVAADFRTGISPEELEQARQQSLRPNREFASAEDGVNRFASSLAPTAASQDMLQHLGRFAIKQTASGGWIYKFDRAALAVSPIEPWERLSAVRLPVLAMRGKESPMMSHEAIVRVGETIPDVRVVEIPGAYHHLFLDRQEDFVREVRDFINRS